MFITILCHKKTDVLFVNVSTTNLMKIFHTGKLVTILLPFGTQHEDIYIFLQITWANYKVESKFCLSDNSYSAESFFLSNMSKEVFRYFQSLQPQSIDCSYWGMMYLHLFRKVATSYLFTLCRPIYHNSCLDWHFNDCCKLLMHIKKRLYTVYQKTELQGNFQKGKFIKVTQSNTIINGTSDSG